MTEWIEHQGKRILTMEVHGFTRDQYVAEVAIAADLVLASKVPANSVLLLVDGAPPDDAFDESAAAWKVFQAKVKGLMCAQTVVGLTGFKRVVARLVVHDIYFASSREDALQWLVKQSR